MKDVEGIEGLVFGIGLSNRLVQLLSLVSYLHPVPWIRQLKMCLLQLFDGLFFHLY